MIVGIALILGAFTGIAVIIGAFMNWNFMMAGTASINPVLVTLSILLILTWKTAGWIGLTAGCCPGLEHPGSQAPPFAEKKNLDRWGGLTNNGVLKPACLLQNPAFFR